MQTTFAPQAAPLSPAFVRWTPKRKADLVASILAERLSAQEAIERYGLSDEELQDWIAAAAHGSKRMRVSAQHEHNRRRRAQNGHSAAAVVGTSR